MFAKSLNLALPASENYFFLIICKTITGQLLGERNLNFAKLVPTYLVLPVSYLYQKMQKTITLYYDCFANVSQAVNKKYKM